MFSLALLYKFAPSFRLPGFIGANRRQYEDWIVRYAVTLLEKRLFQHRGPEIRCPNTASDYLRLQLLQEDREVFAVIFLDNQKRVVAFERLFYGTINAAAVYPRVILERALAHKCASVIISHNHPSGETAPSDADTRLTDKVKTALKLVDIAVDDHIIIGQGTPFSFAQQGLLR